MVPAPRIGQWYINKSGAAFEVVAIDAASSTIELQYYDGTVDEYDLEGWLSTTVEEAAPPEDYSGSLDISADDYEMNSHFIPRRDWSDPLDFIDTDYFDNNEIKLDL